MLTVVLSLWAGVARASDRLTELSTKLRTDKDFRVRTQAALALGVSQSDRAVPPLCSGLEDENHTVRAASAAAGGPSARVVPIATSENPTAARRPANSRLDNGRLARIHGVQLPHWQQSLQGSIERLVAAA